MTDTPAQPPLVKVTQHSPFSAWLIWLVPAIAVVIGLWLGVKSVLSHGPTITISFHSAEGLEAGKTKIKYKDVDIGIVKKIHLTPDHTRVEVTAELNKAEGVDALLVADSRFWVVRPHISAGGVTGLGTLLSGAYIGLDIGRSEESQREFKGLEVPPIVTADLPGRRFILKAQNLGSLGIGSPLYFRRVQVGQVVAFDLDANGKQVSFTVFVNAPYDRFVTTRSRFWHASGVDVTLTADGVRVTTESLISVVSGGIAFQDLGVAFETPLPEAAENTAFTLNADRAQALKQPDLYSFEYLLLFQSSVRGLSVGAPVDFRGLAIGEVTAISVEDGPSAKNTAPQIAVTVRIYPSRVPTLAGIQSEDGTSAGQRAALNPMVAKGFRAQLRSGSLLTGQLFVSIGAASLPCYPQFPAALTACKKPWPA
jgi:paraquat-inducible protein B